MDSEAFLRNIIGQTFPEVGRDTVEKLCHYYRELLKWNAAINLISRKDPEKTAARLIVDSLFLTNLLEGTERVLDVGAGAGLPGIPVSLCMNLDVTLVEAKQKRAAFLSHLKGILRMNNVQVFNEAASEKTLRRYGRFEVLWAKGALSLKTLFAMGASCLSQGGKIILFRSFEGKEERARVGDLAMAHGFYPPVFHVYACPELYLTRTLTVCRKGQRE